MSLENINALANYRPAGDDDDDKEGNNNGEPQSQSHQQQQSGAGDDVFESPAAKVNFDNSTIEIKQPQFSNLVPPPQILEETLTKSLILAVETCNAREKQDKARKKELGKKISKWMETFRSKNNGREPNQGDIEDDPQMASDYAEYTELQRVTKNKKQNKNNNNADDDKDVDLAKQRKAVVKEIEKWKKSWIIQFGAPPTDDDIRGDTTVKHHLQHLETLGVDMVLASVRRDNPQATAVMSRRQSFVVAGNTNNDNNNATRVEQVRPSTSGAIGNNNGGFGRYRNDDDFGGGGRSSFGGDAIDASRPRPRLASVFGGPSSGNNSSNGSRRRGSVRPSTSGGQNEDDEFF